MPNLSSQMDPQKGALASCSTISGRLMQTINKGDNIKDQPSPNFVKVHTTKFFSAFWAFQHQANVFKIFKVVTWSSVSKFYQVIVSTSSDASFRCKVPCFLFFYLGLLAIVCLIIQN